MSDKAPPHIDDIDDFLLRDSLAELSTTSLPRLFLSDPVAGARAADKLGKLSLRVTHINGSLTAAADSVAECRDGLDAERECMAEFEQEMVHWNTLMGELEAAIAEVHGAKPESHERITSAKVSAAVGAELDAAVAAEADAADIFTRVLAANEVPDAVIGDSDATINRDQHELLLTLIAQESRIKELEQQLTKLRGPANSPGEHAAGLPAQADQPYVNRLLVALNSTENLKFPLTHNIMTIGREPTNDIHISSRYISRFHARIVSDHDASTIEDLDSRNGVRVNSHKVNRRHTLRSGDIIDFGRLQFKFIDLMQVSSGEGSA